MTSAIFENAQFFRVVGLFGVCLYVMNYTLLSWHVVTSSDRKFFMVNATAATLVLLSNYIEFNLASVMIQVFWIVISTKAIFLRRSGPGQRRHG